ncbi:MAG: hypothetical protein HQ472_00670 [Ignavibacteria bacterium]|nr:hypothetical protein [Ignavibacteria bacterium]
MKVIIATLVTILVILFQVTILYSQVEGKYKYVTSEGYVFTSPDKLHWELVDRIANLGRCPLFYSRSGYDWIKKNGIWSLIRDYRLNYNVNDGVTRNDKVPSQQLFRVSIDSLKNNEVASITLYNSIGQSEVTFLSLDEYIRHDRSAFQFYYPVVRLINGKQLIIESR